MLITPIILLTNMDKLVQKNDESAKKPSQKALRAVPDIAADDFHDGTRPTPSGHVKDDAVQEDDTGDETLAGTQLALEKLRQSSEYGDPRTPEIDPAPLDRLWTPDAETLNNPEEYAKQQKKLEKKA